MDPGRNLDQDRQDESGLRKNWCWCRQGWGYWIVSERKEVNHTTVAVDLEVPYVVPSMSKYTMERFFAQIWLLKRWCKMQPRNITVWLDIPAFSEFNVLRINIYWRRKYRTLCLEHSELNSGGRNTSLVLIKGCFCGLNWSWALQIPGDVSWKIIYAVNTLLDEVERFSWKKLEIVWIYLAHR